MATYTPSSHVAAMVRRFAAFRALGFTYSEVDDLTETEPEVVLEAIPSRRDDELTRAYGHGRPVSYDVLRCSWAKRIVAEVEAGRALAVYAYGL